MSELKITVGIGTTEDYPAVTKAGADEIFFGYVPFEYQKQFGQNYPLNRREVIFTNVQAGSKSELEILKDMIDTIGIKAAVTLNAITYAGSAREFIIELVKDLKKAGFTDFILADEALIDAVSKLGVNVHVSGEYGELSSLTIRHLAKYGPKRIIFPRQTTIAEMRSMIMTGKKLGIMEYEAFVLNERCQFTGAYCNSRHCDEFSHMCLVPYKVDCKVPEFEEKVSSCIGETGCGLCALYDLKTAGITHIKLVSRGNYSENTVEDVKNVKKALSILETCEDREEYIKRMKAELFEKGCSNNCYYNL